MSAFPPPPPPGLVYIVEITPSVNLIILGTFWTAMLVPLLILLFWLSTPQLRRQPVFDLNVISVSAGIGLGLLNLALYVSEVLKSSGGNIPATEVYIAMTVLIPPFIDSILMFRLIVVYPGTTSKSLRAIIFVPLIVFKIVRIANLTVFLVKFITRVHTSGSEIVAFQKIWDREPWIKIEWFLQIFDNCYASAFFLWKMRQGQITSKQSGAVSRGNRYANALQQLFYLGLGSFAFPCMLSIAQVIVIYNNHDFFTGIYIYLTNVYVEIIGVLMATLWTAGNHWFQDRKPAQESSGLSTTKLSTLNFKKNLHSARGVIGISTEVTTDIGSNSIPMDTFLRMISLTREV